MFISYIEDVRGHLPITNSISEVNKYSFLFYRVSDCLMENLNPRDYGYKCHLAVYRIRNFLLDSRDKTSISKYLPNLTNIEFEEIVSKILTMCKNTREYDSTNRTYAVVDKNTNKKYIPRPCFENVSTDSMASYDSKRSSDYVIAFESVQEGGEGSIQLTTSVQYEGDQPTEETPLISVESSW